MAYPDQKNLVAQRTYLEKRQVELKAAIATRISQGYPGGYTNTLRASLKTVESQLATIATQLYGS